MIFEKFYAPFKVADTTFPSKRYILSNISSCLHDKRARFNQIDKLIFFREKNKPEYTAYLFERSNKVRTLSENAVAAFASRLTMGLLLP